MEEKANDLPTEQVHEAVDVTEQETEVIEAFERLPEESRTRVTSMMVSREFHGPLPPASEFREYNKVLPGAAERILAMAEKNVSMLEKTTDAHIQNENKIVDHNINEEKKGSCFGLLIGIGALGSAVYLASTGHDWVAGGIITSIVALVALFITRSKPSQSSSADSPS